MFLKNIILTFVKQYNMGTEQSTYEYNFSLVHIDDGPVLAFTREVAKLLDIGADKRANNASASSSFHAQVIYCIKTNVLPACCNLNHCVTYMCHSHRQPLYLDGFLEMIWKTREIAKKRAELRPIREDLNLMRRFVYDANDWKLQWKRKNDVRLENEIDMAASFFSLIPKPYLTLTSKPHTIIFHCSRCKHCMPVD